MQRMKRVKKVQPLRKELSLCDFGVLSFIFFGYFISLSLWMYFCTDDVQIPSAASFSDYSNIFSIVLELVLLILAGVYLRWRRFHFSSLNFSVSFYTLPLMLLLVLLGAVLIDVCIYGSYWIIYGVNPLSYLSAWRAEREVGVFAHITLWLVLFSLLNGFFEELFFMGFTFAVTGRYRIYAIIASVCIRFSFHLYQGIASAMGIALIGLGFILVRRKVASLVPFMLAHAVFDIFGAGILFWFSEVVAGFTAF